MKLLRVALAGCFLAAMVWAADPSGKWSGEMAGRNGQKREVTLNLKADGDKLTGSVGGRMGDTDITNGKVDGDTIKFDLVREFNGNTMTMHYTGKVSGDSIQFTVARDGADGPGMEFTATRK